MHIQNLRETPVADSEHAYLTGTINEQLVQEPSAQYQQLTSVIGYRVGNVTDLLFIRTQPRIPRSRVQSQRSTRAIVLREAVYAWVSWAHFSELGVEREGGMLLHNVFQRFVTVLAHLL